MASFDETLLDQFHKAHRSVAVNLPFELRGTGAFGTSAGEPCNRCRLCCAMQICPLAIELFRDQKRRAPHWNSGLRDFGVG